MKLIDEVGDAASKLGVEDASVVDSQTLFDSLLDLGLARRALDAFEARALGELDARAGASTPTATRPPT